MTHDRAVPFVLPERPAVTRVRQRDIATLRRGLAARTQPMPGYDLCYGDIVDYIVRITEEIWRDRAIGRIYDTYDASCTIYTSSGVVRSVESVVAATIASLNAYPDQVTDHVNIAWSGDADTGFYTSHLGLSSATNLGASEFGPATGKPVKSFFVADCISRENRIHTEWLIHDSGAVLHHLGLDAHDIARSMASEPGVYVTSPPARPAGQARRSNGASSATPEDWAHHHFASIWTARRLEHLPHHYAADAVAHWPGCRAATGPRAIGDLIIGLLTSLPDAVARVEHVCWSEETDGVILAVRWVLEGRTQAGGLLGAIPAGRTIAMRGSSHLRFGDGRIVEEWTVFDELAALVEAYRP
jgi:hypothetical protein